MGRDQRIGTISAGKPLLDLYQGTKPDRVPLMYAKRQEQPIRHKGELFTPQELKALNMMRLSDRLWRLDNLYSIVDEQGGKMVPFRLRPVQRDFLENMWYFNVILKSRQHGFTTLIDLWMLDLVLFTPNVEAVIIAHRQEDAARILTNKVEKPYANLHPAIRERRRLTDANKSMLKFDNESSITVQVSGRSGTTQAMHISELGYTANHRPLVAQEIITGSYSAVHPGSFCFVESTAMGASGPFYKICQTALAMKQDRKKLTPKDYKFHFYAWFDKANNVLSDEDTVHVMADITDRMVQYFKNLEDKHGIFLSDAQKAWYIVEEKTLEDKMKQENPSTPEEAFENSTVGNYFQRQMNLAREENRITKVPHQPGRLVHLYFDIGINDPTAVWFIQQVGPWFHALYYLEEDDKSLGEVITQCLEIASERGYVLGNYVGPHDLRQRRNRMKGPAISLEDEANKMGIEFVVVPKVAEKSTAINIARRMLSSCRFDESGCELGIQRLDNYRKEWLESVGIFSDKPRHDENSDGADAFQTFALSVEGADLEAQKQGKARKQPQLMDQTPNVGDETDQPYETGGQKQPTRSMRAYT